MAIDAHPVARVLLQPPPAAACIGLAWERQWTAQQSTIRTIWLGRQTLAALGAAPRDDIAAANGRHTGAEAVPALAHELARLISPLHDTFSIMVRRQKPPLIQSSTE
jgi:hypothetical protein